VSDVFGSLYADTYDDVYRTKDYEAECDLLERIWQGMGSSPVRSVLDLGCGTGNHALPLAARGYEVVGVDRSEQMIARATAKASESPSSDRRTFQQGDIRHVRLGRTFDAVTMLFAVLGYQTQNEDVLAALQTARAHLSREGLLVADVWYGPAVLHERPEQRVAVVKADGSKMLRVTGAAVDTLAQCARVHYRLWQIEDDRVVGEAEEEHEMRFFFPRELELMLDVSGLSLVRLGAFPDIDTAPDESTWNVVLVARAV
jgi:SAM-dependent methyltransferase